MLGVLLGVQDGNLSLARELLSKFRVTKHGSRKPLRVVSDPLSYEVRDRVSRRKKGPLSLSRYPRTLWRPGVLNFEGDSVCAGHASRFAPKSAKELVMAGPGIHGRIILRQVKSLLDMSLPVGAEEIGGRLVYYGPWGSIVGQGRDLSLPTPGNDPC